jgi:allophanate hydrolase subunit 2
MYECRQFGKYLTREWLGSDVRAELEETGEGEGRDVGNGDELSCGSDDKLTNEVPTSKWQI